MEDDRTLRIVILPDAPSTGPLIDLLRALVVQRLIDPPILLVDNTLHARRLGPTPDTDEVKPLRTHIETAHCRRFLLINLVTADAIAPRRDSGSSRLSTVSPVSAESDSAELLSDLYLPDVERKATDEHEHKTSVVPELRTAFEVDFFIRNALAFKSESNSGEAAQRLDVINLIVPAAQARSLPTYLHSQGPRIAANVSGWSNVVVAPEIQATSLQAVVPVMDDQEYVAHTGGALITVAGCWAGASWDPEFPSWQPNLWTVVRCRSRSIVAPELPARVLSRIGTSANRVPVSDDVEYSIAPDPNHAVELALHQIVKRHKLSLKPFVSVEERSAQQIISIGDFFRIVWAWLTGTLPSLVIDEVRDRVQNMGDRVDERINRRAGLNDETQYRIRFLGRKRQPKQAIVEEDVDEFQRQDWRFITAEPSVWSSLRQLSFGLLDGGDVNDDTLTGLLGVGGQRFVLGDQGLISPPPNVSLWQPSSAVLAAGIGPGPSQSVVDVEWAAGWTESLKGLIGKLKASVQDEQDEKDRDLSSLHDLDSFVGAGRSAASKGADSGREAGAGDHHPFPVPELVEPGSGVPADVTSLQLLSAAQRDLDSLQVARELAGRSLLWGLGEHLFAEYQKAKEHVAGLREQVLQAQQDAADPSAVEDAGQKAKRRALSRLLVGLGVLTAAVVGVYFGLRYAALPGGMLVLAVAASILLWILGLLRSVWKCVRSWFLAEQHLHWIQQGRLEVLDQGILIEDAQVRRFEYLCASERDWSDLIATICYHPFRRPTIDSFQRVREPDLGLTSSHQIIEGYTTEPRLEGITSSVAAELIRPGWLSATFQSALQYAKEEHNLRTRGGSFQPDEDASISSTRIGPRRALVDATVSGRARRRREIEVLGRIHMAIRSGVGFSRNPTERDAPIEDRLFTPLSAHMLPSQFLNESVAGPPSNFNREFIPIATMPTRVAHITSQAVELPPPPSIEEVIEGVTAEFPPLVFSTWAIETAQGTPMRELEFFADDATPALLDLEIALTRWVPPPDECLGSVTVRSSEDRVGWALEPDRLARIASLITPYPDARPAPGRGSYRFLIQQDGEPLSHPARTPIKYAVRSDVAPPGAEDMIQRALQAVADRSGNEFVLDGTFTGLPGNEPGRVEIGWAFDDEFREWERSTGKTPGSAIAWGSPFAVADALGQQVLAGGSVLLNADMDCEIGFLPGASHGNVLLHELGHVMNLGHVDDPREIMQPRGFTQQQSLDYGPGDTLGLHALRDSSLRIVGAPDAPQVRRSVQGIWSSPSDPRRAGVMSDSGR